MATQIGNKVKELRAQHGWTQMELAKRSGIKRGYLASIEAGLVSNPSVPVFLQLSKALGVTSDELYAAAGYAEKANNSPRFPETPEEIIDQLKTVQPTAIPIYKWEEYPSEFNNTTGPLDYIYRARRRSLGRRMEAYLVKGSVYKPVVKEDDIIIIDTEASIDEGDLIACRRNGIPAIGHIKKIGGELFLISADGQTKFSECQVPNTIVEVRRWLLKQETE